MSLHAITKLLLGKTEIFHVSFPSAIWDKIIILIMINDTKTQ